MGSIYKMNYQRLAEILSLLVTDCEIDTTMNVYQLIEYLDENIGEIIVE